MPQEHQIDISNVTKAANALKAIARAFESGELTVPTALRDQGHDGLDLAIMLMLIARTLDDHRKE